ncbi:putative esterase/lipase [Penicillium brasilianum]|uniref:Putative esterase/lipase n=1 Tax=Penicillium brasilianum TaxID=104259 RepID=A0A1S9RGJ8_PENBI|nr:putative esterase/lipase [Penicillium brasilianum]
MGLTYIYHKSIAIFLRGLVRYRLDLHPKPDETIFIPSRDAGRNIKAHVYKPVGEKQKQPSPVLINFCGSGFVLGTFGTDDEFCRFISDNTDYTVIDVQYRLAPEHPFPSAFNDAEDVVTWVRSLPEQFDTSCISLSGFSAGGNIALAVSCSSSLVQSEASPDVFRAVMVFYAPVDMAVPTPQKPLVDRSNFIMRKIFPTFSHLCHKCLNFAGFDPKDHRLSPFFADPSKFPPNILMITAAQCAFAIEVEKLAENIRNVDGKYVVCKRMDGCAHGWDKEAIQGTPQAEAKDEAYEMAANMLRRREMGAEKPSMTKV